MAGARRRQHDARDSLGMMPWYPRDWRASSARAQLSTVGRLAYRELLDAGWLQGGSLPPDDRSLAGLAGISPKEWARVREEVLAYFDVGEDGRLRNRRQAWEHERAVSLRDARRAGAAKTNKGPQGGTPSAPLSVPPRAMVARNRPSMAWSTRTFSSGSFHRKFTCKLPSPAWP